MLRPLRAINRIPSKYENIENFTDKWHNIEDESVFKAHCGLETKTVPQLDIAFSN